MVKQKKRVSAPGMNPDFLVPEGAGVIDSFKKWEAKTLPKFRGITKSINSLKSKFDDLKDETCFQKEILMDIKHDLSELDDKVFDFENEFTQTKKRLFDLFFVNIFMIACIFIGFLYLLTEING